MVTCIDFFLITSIYMIREKMQKKNFNSSLRLTRYILLHTIYRCLAIKLEGKQNIIYLIILLIFTGIKRRWRKKQLWLHAWQSRYVYVNNGFINGNQQIWDVINILKIQDDSPRLMNNTHNKLLAIAIAYVSEESL